MQKISFILNQETNMPYQFEVVNFHAIKNEYLIKHIEGSDSICFPMAVSMTEIRKSSSTAYLFHRSSRLPF